MEKKKRLEDQCIDHFTLLLKNVFLLLKMFVFFYLPLELDRFPPPPLVVVLIIDCWGYDFRYLSWFSAAELIDIVKQVYMILVLCLHWNLGEILAFVPITWSE